MTPPIVKVLFATPAYSGLGVGYFTSLTETRAILKAHGIESGVSFIEGDALIGRARNSLVRQFLDTDFTHLFFIDSDLEWDPVAPLKMVSAGKSMVMGLYPLKEDAEAYHISFETDLYGNAEMINGLLPVKHGGAGFLYIKREAIERMIEKYPETHYKGAGYFEGRDLYNLFSCEVIDGLYYGEDTSFCERWKQIEGNIYAMPDILFNHVGTKKYGGNYMKHIEALCRL